MEASKPAIVKPNYMIMSLQRILVLIVIFSSVFIVVYYTPMPGKIFKSINNNNCLGFIFIKLISRIVTHVCDDEMY